MKQVSDARSTISSTYLNVFYSKLRPLDEYIICQTDDNEYTMLVRNMVNHDDVKEYVIYRTGTNASYQMYESESTWSYDISNEIYVYSNIGYGTMSVLPCHEIMIAWSIIVALCCGALWVMFRGGLFAWRRNTKS